MWFLQHEFTEYLLDTAVLGAHWQVRRAGLKSSGFGTAIGERRSSLCRYVSGASSVGKAVFHYLGDMRGAQASGWL